jgi:hypothetical protein
MKSRQKERGQGRMKRKPFVSGLFGSVYLVLLRVAGHLKMQGVNVFIAAASSATT